MRDPSNERSTESRRTTKQVRLHEGAFDKSLKEALRNYEEHSVPSDSREEDDDDESLEGQDAYTVLVKDDPREGDDSSQDYEINENEAAFRSVQSSQ
jgi:hypothetical protein